MIWPARRVGALLGDDDAGLAQHVAEEGDQHLAARVQRGKREFRARGLQHQRRIGKAEVEALVAARHRGARRQHHAAAAIEQVDQIVEPLGVAGELLDGPRDRKPAAGAVFALRRAGRRLSCSCDPLTKLAEGAPHRTNEKAAALRWRPLTICENEIAPATSLEGAPPKTGWADDGAHGRLITIGGRRCQGTARPRPAAFSGHLLGLSKAENTA